MEKIIKGIWANKGGEKQELFLKQQSRSPLRYGLYRGSLAESSSGRGASLSRQQLLLSIGHQSLRQFFSEDILNQFFTRKILAVKIEYEKLYALEHENLRKDVFHYLAKAEKSPLALENWLKKRSVPQELQNSLVAEALEKAYLSKERFAHLYVQKRFHQASRPWWRTALELRQLGIEAEISEAHLYDDLAMLDRYWFGSALADTSRAIDMKKLQPYLNRSRNVSKNAAQSDAEDLSSAEQSILATLMKKLISQGFSYDTARALLGKIEAALRKKEIF